MRIINDRQDFAPTKIFLTLRELEAAACTTLSILLALYHAAVTGKESVCLKR